MFHQFYFDFFITVSYAYCVILSCFLGYDSVVKPTVAESCDKVHEPQAVSPFPSSSSSFLRPNCDAHSSHLVHHCHEEEDGDLSGDVAMIDVESAGYQCEESDHDAFLLNDVSTQSASVQEGAIVPNLPFSNSRGEFYYSWLSS